MTHRIGWTGGRRATRRPRSSVLLVLAACLAFFGAAAWAQPAAEGRHIAVSLVPDTVTPASGRTVTLAIVMQPQPGWHGYWRNPGDAGLPPRLTWELPAGVAAGEPAYPTPRALLIAGMMNHVYEKPYALLVPLTIPAGLERGTRLPIRLAMSYLVCTTEVCVPEQASVAASVTVGDGGTDPATAQRFADWRRALPQPAPATASYALDGGVFRLSVLLPQGADPVSPHLFLDAADTIDFAAPQRFSRTGDALIVETKAAGGGAQGQLAAVLDLGGGSALELSATPGSVAAAGTPLAPAGGSAQQAAAPAGGGMVRLTLVAFVGAVLGGLILNVMPCVFPILSLKALSLARSSEDHGEARRDALAYSAGVIAVCLGLGILILALRAAGDQVGWAFQLQRPGVIFGLILLVTAIGFNLTGLFELSSLNAGSGLAAKTGTAGAFWTGALAAFVATPCTGPFMAAALGAALVLPLAAALLIFIGLGLGLSLPFLAIGFIPRLRAALPRPGAWMNTFRHVLAVPMFVTALGLAWVIGNQTGTFGIVLSLAALLILSIGLWATGLRQHAMKSHAWMPGAIAGLISIGLVTLLPDMAAAKAERGTRAGVEAFDPARLASLRSEGKPIFLYLTADWCLSCKVNEKAAIERTQTQEAFRTAGVVTMIGDWTGGDARITDFLQQHGRSGVPLYLWYAPGREPRVLPQILTPAMLAGLAKDGSSG